MRRFFTFLILLQLLVLPAGAAQNRRYIALVIDSGPHGENTQLLLDGLYDRGIHATFLLQGSALAGMPEVLTRLLEEGHEIGCRGYTGENMTLMSRRTIAGEIMEFEALLPESYPLKLFCPPGGVSDGVRQVAQARRLGILSWSASLDTPVEQLRDGDILLLTDGDRLSLEESLAMADRLLEADFRPVTVSRLAGLRQARIDPGKIYSRFPPEEEGS